MDKLQEWMDAGERVLIHCEAGRSRSPAVTIAYLMLSNSISYKEALRQVAEKRSINMNEHVWNLAYDIELELDLP